MATHLRACNKHNLVVCDDPILLDALDDPDAWLPSSGGGFHDSGPYFVFGTHWVPAAWGAVLERALFDAAHLNTVSAWTRLLMLPKCVLVASRRGGKRNRGDHHSVSYLCEAWERGDVKWLWKRATRAPAPKPRLSSGGDSKRVFEAAITHVRHGRLGKACRTLASEGLAPDSEETHQQLLDKHPQLAPPKPVPDVEGDSPALQLGSDFNLQGVLSSFAKDVGTDSTNFRVQHLVDALSANLPRTLLATLRSVINLLLAGRAHEDTRPFLAGAKLTALSKGDSDIRPIAAGNVFRRIASKCVCQLHQARFRSVLGKHQAGVAQPAGAESIVHLTREVLSRKWDDPDFVVLKVDFANAFNSIDRHAMLVQCRELFPELLPWVRWCYGDRPWLFHQTGNLRSCAGVQQGDPLGPLLFCLVLNILIVRLAERCPLLGSAQVVLGRRRAGRPCCTCAARLERS